MKERAGQLRTTGKTKGAGKAAAELKACLDAMDGRVVCVFQPGAKLQSRYATFGLNDFARLDDGTRWPTAWALTGLTTKLEAELAASVRKAVS